MFSLIKKYDKNVERLYSYNWFVAGCTSGFDGGLVEAHGAVPPALAAFTPGPKHATNEHFPPTRPPPSTLRAPR